jgi:hypothetical protein
MRGTTVGEGKEAEMTRRLGLAVVAVLAVNALVTGYGAVAAGEEAQLVCHQDHGTVRHHECMKNGKVLFNVPL